MKEKEYMNEDSYKKVKTVLIVIGCLSLVLAVALIILGVMMKVPDMGADNWFEMSSKRMLTFAGAFVFGIMIPLITFTIAFRREMFAFTLQQTMPLAQEGVEKMTPTAAKSAGTIAKEVTKGIREGLKEDDEEQ